MKSVLEIFQRLSDVTVLSFANCDNNFKIIYQRNHGYSFCHFIKGTLSTLVFPAKLLVRKCHYRKLELECF